MIMIIIIIIITYCYLYYNVKEKFVLWSVITNSEMNGHDGKTSNWK